MEVIKCLSRMDLFNGLSDDELAQLNHATPLETRNKGTVVASPHMDQKVLYIIKSGKVRLYKLTAEGKELTLDILGAGHLFGEMTSFHTGSAMFAITMEDSVICEIESRQFRRMIGEKPDLALKYIELVTGRLKEMEELLEYMAYGSVRERLLFLLHKLASKFSPDSEAAQDWMPLEIELTHQELATMTGSIRETVTPIINQLVSEGVLRKEGARKPYSIHRSRLEAAIPAFQ
ncbi:MAG: Crp/Fnr family transcriptional regulator [Paenibacillus lautus]|uniref:Crp/Fnr family transcriptional regulator n=1 Tax=Paenibacillus lautus TaxID=1401 RepID=UPI0026EBF43D|nr:Crp/Fnr family transcriptional regulator [Paenibacillus lautus]MCI1774497.1 Crp/Fnr family transcriptional regulator [Paenibacillus lautus]